jgi:hypothetical protein
MDISAVYGGLMPDGAESSETKNEESYDFPQPITISILKKMFKFSQIE